MTNDMPCELLDRKWMKAAKAWRCFLLLPDDVALASAITFLIERKVVATITDPATGRQVELNPGFIVDVPTAKGGRFHLVLETEQVYESRDTIGPNVTVMLRQPVLVTLVAYTGQSELKPAAQPQAPLLPRTDIIGAIEMRGLHLNFFKLPKFWDFIKSKGFAFETEDGCKDATKLHLGVASCRDITIESHRAMLKEFNAFAQGGR